MLVEWLCKCFRHSLNDNEEISDKNNEKKERDDVKIVYRNYVIVKHKYICIYLYNKIKIYDYKKRGMIKARVVNFNQITRGQSYCLNLAPCM